MTKLGIYFDGFLNNSAQIPTVSLNYRTIPGLDYSNGLGASINEQYIFKNAISQHPVQTGIAITDAIIPQQKEVFLEGIITTQSTKTIVTFVDFYQLGNAVQLLIDNYNKKVGMTLVSGLLYGQQYYRLDNMVIEELIIPRTNEYGKTSIKFQMQLKQIVIVNDIGNSTGNVNAVGYDGAVPT